MTLLHVQSYIPENEVRDIRGGLCGNFFKGNIRVFFIAVDFTLKTEMSGSSETILPLDCKVLHPQTFVTCYKIRRCTRLFKL